MKSKSSPAISATPRLTRRFHRAKPGHSLPLLLIVDDVEFIRIMMKRYLELNAGVRVVTAETSEEALEMARSHRNLNLVISDICRPGMDGLAFLQAFKKERPTVPVMIISGAMNPALRQRAYRCGAIACYSKPLLLNRLLGAVTRNLK
jgi:DNA-binding NtrC family response regulator